MSRKSQAEKLRHERSETSAKLEAIATRIGELENEGAVTEKAINELTRLNATRQLAQAAIRRIDSEMPAALDAERRAEIERLEVIQKTERQAYEKALSKTTEAACKILAPEDANSPPWDKPLFHKRRRHEIGMFAKDHPDVKRHDAAAKDAAAQIDRLRHPGR